MNIAVEFADTALQIQKDKKHEWMMPTKDVAAGYGVSEAAIRNHKERHADELEEGKHFISVTNSDANPRAGIPHTSTIWTKRGVIRLGFFIKSERAKTFRDWAEEFILSGGKQSCVAPKLPSAPQIREMIKNYGRNASIRMIGKSLRMSETEVEATLIDARLLDPAPQAESWSLFKDMFSQAKKSGQEEKEFEVE